MNKPSFKFKLRWKISYPIVFLIILIITISCFITLSQPQDHYHSEASNNDVKNQVTNLQIGVIPILDDMNKPMASRTRAKANNSFDTPPNFIKQLKDVKLDEDFEPYILDLAGYAYDNQDPPKQLRYFIIGDNKSLINVYNENSSDQEIIIKPVLNAFGENKVTVGVSDLNGSVAYQVWNIRINPINDLPSLLHSELPILKIHCSDEYSIDLRPYIFDPDTPRSKIVVWVDPEDSEYASIQENRLILNFKSDSGFEKNYITLRLSDGVKVGEFQYEKIHINLTNNHPPTQIKLIPDISIFKDEVLYKIFDLDYYFTDPDSDLTALTYEFKNVEHLNIKIYKDNTIDIAGNSTWDGIEEVIIRCVDPYGAFKEQVVYISVSSKIPSITLSIIPDLIVRYEIMYSFSLKPYIMIDQQKPEFIIEIYEFIGTNWLISEEFSHIIVDSKNEPILKINYSEKYLNQTIPVFISISDGISTSFQEFSIVVTDNYPPTLKTVIPNQQFDEDNNDYVKLDLYEFFSDNEEGLLDFSTFSENIIFNVDENGIITFNSKPNWFGHEFVTIRASDSDGALVETSILVTVKPINDPPELLPIPQIDIIKGVQKSFNYTIYILDVDNALHELTVTLSGEHVTLAGDFLILDYPSNIGGEQKFTLTVSDGKASISQDVKVYITSQVNQKDQKIIEISPIMFWGAIVILIILILLLLVMAIVHIKRSRSFMFNEIYLIYKDGLLIAHATRAEKSSHDSDIIGSMFTAIQDFIQESFTDTKKSLEGSPLKRLEFGDFQVVIDRGEHVYIAAVFSGFAMRKMMLRIENLRKDIEKEYKDVLPGWKGDMEQLKGTSKLLEKLLYSTGPTPNKAKERKYSPTMSTKGVYKHSIKDKTEREEYSIDGTHYQRPKSE